MRLWGDTNRLRAIAAGALVLLARCLPLRLALPLENLAARIERGEQ
jgi:hypothetical protein